VAERTWETSMVSYCEHVKGEVALEAEMLFPMDELPDPPRGISHRCTRGAECNQSGKAACHGIVVRGFVITEHDLKGSLVHPRAAGGGLRCRTPGFPWHPIFRGSSRC